MITNHLPIAQIIKPLRKNEPETVIIDSVLTKAMEFHSQFLDDGATISVLKKAANILRQEILQDSHRGWSFSGNFDGFQNPPPLQFFLSRLLFGHHINQVAGMRNEEIDKTVDVACQLLVQNTRSDRQVKHQPKKNYKFRHTILTPLSIGLPLAIHSRVRDKTLVDNLSDVYIGSEYKKILDLEKRVEQGVLQRMKETGGFCLPDFVKKGVNIWFAVDNIDLLEDTPSGQNTFHGTLIVINQQAEDGEPLNEPLVIPEKVFSPTPLQFELKYLPEQPIKAKPVRFPSYLLGQHQHHLSSDFTYAWALANYFTTHPSNDESTTVQQEGILMNRIIKRATQMLITQFCC